MNFCRITSRWSWREIIFPEHGISIPLQDQAFIAAMALDFADKLDIRNPDQMQYILKSMLIFHDEEMKHDHRRYLMQNYNIDMNADLPVGLAAQIIKAEHIDINFFK